MNTTIQAILIISGSVVPETAGGDREIVGDYGPQRPEVGTASTAATTKVFDG
jgi:hypothetical protein